MASWRGAVLGRDADTVLSLDRMFTARPDRYRAALTTSASDDADERVRAFSTRVLGKLKQPELVPLFKRKLSDQSRFVRQNAAWALGELGATGAGRAAAADALAALRDASRHDAHEDVRVAAAGALEKLD